MGLFYTQLQTFAAATRAGSLQEEAREPRAGREAESQGRAEALSDRVLSAASGNTNARGVSLAIWGCHPGMRRLVQWFDVRLWREMGLFLITSGPPSLQVPPQGLCSVTQCSTVTAAPVTVLVHPFAPVLPALSPLPCVRERPDQGEKSPCIKMKVPIFCVSLHFGS